jgi:uncharacterized membrane protein HdeD (DUF308 family)
MSTRNESFAGILSKSWWALLLRGGCAIAFGVLTWTQPGISLAALVLLFGMYTLADGILGVWTAVAGRNEHEHWFALLLWGLVSIGVGILTFLAPGLTGLALLFYIAIWAIATGVLQIVTAIRLRKEIEGEWLLVLAGLASVAFGALLMARPGAGALALLWMIATYAVIFGSITVVLAFKARSFAKRLVGT